MKLRQLNIMLSAFASVLVSCGGQSESEKINTTEGSKQQVEEPLDTRPEVKYLDRASEDSVVAVLSDFTVDSIRKYSAPLRKEIAVEHAPDGGHYPIPSSFLKQYIEGHLVSNTNERLNAYYPVLYRFHEFKEFSNFYLFSFLYDDESCCTYVYYVTLSKKPLKTIDICLMGYDGGDGDWYGDKSGEWHGPNRIELIETSNTDPYLDEGQNMERDTAWYETTLDNSGKFTEIKYKTVKYRGGKKIKYAH